MTSFDYDSIKSLSTVITFGKKNPISPKEEPSLAVIYLLLVEFLQTISEPLLNSQDRSALIGLADCMLHIAS